MFLHRVRTEDLLYPFAQQTCVCASCMFNLIPKSYLGGSGRVTQEDRSIYTSLYVSPHPLLFVLCCAVLCLPRSFNARRAQGSMRNLRGSCYGGLLEGALGLYDMDALERS